MSLSHWMIRWTRVRPQRERVPMRGTHAACCATGLYGGLRGDRHIHEAALAPPWQGGESGT